MIPAIVLAAVPLLFPTVFPGTPPPRLQTDVQVNTHGYLAIIRYLPLCHGMWPSCGYAEVAGSDNPSLSTLCPSHSIEAKPRITVKFLGHIATYTPNYCRYGRPEAMLTFRRGRYYYQIGAFNATLNQLEAMARSLSALPPCEPPVDDSRLCHVPLSGFPKARRALR